VLGVNVHALDPPDVAVAPVAVLVGDHELPDDNAVDLGDEVAALVRVGEHRADAAADDSGLERLRLGLAGDARVVVGEHVGVLGTRGADQHRMRCRFRHAGKCRMDVTGAQAAGSLQ
jgi:hypothetical protein